MSSVTSQILALLETTGRTVYVFLRGAQGSGKSHLTAIIREMCTAVEVNVMVISADLFFYMDHDGTNPEHEYRHDGARLGEAHKWAVEQMRGVRTDDGKTVVLIDNTNTTPFDVKAYLCALAGADVHKDQICLVNLVAQFSEPEEVSFIDRGIQLMQAASMKNVSAWTECNLKEHFRKEAQGVIAARQKPFQCTQPLVDLLWKQHRDSLERMHRFCQQNTHTVPESIVVRVVIQSQNPTMVADLKPQFGQWIEECAYMC